MTIVLSIVLLSIAFTLLALRVLLVRGGEFRGTCATNNPYLEEAGAGCTLCGKASDEPCHRWSPHRWKAILMGSRREPVDR